MKGILSVFFLVMAMLPLAQAQNLAEKRAKTLQLGVNLSYLEGWWGGTKAKHYGDAFSMTEILKRKSRMADIAKSGFKSVRIPICFSAWATLDEPYQWDFSQHLPLADSLVTWALQNNLVAIIDLHHAEFDNAEPTRTTSDARMVWLWQQIASRYQKTDPEKVIFELRNEPHDITPAAWRTQAEKLITTVRKIAPKHTIIAGATEWNGIDALTKFEPFTDDNIIYTFHSYDPFVFTHQGATWAGSGLPELKNVPFPYESPLTVPSTAKGTWVESAINNYKNDGHKEALFTQIKKAKNWADEKKVPIYCGEGGSYNLNASTESRCSHATALISIMGTLGISFSWWEWDGGFTMFYKDKFGTLLPCMITAMQSYTTPITALKNLPKEMEIGFYPNPVGAIILVEEGVKVLEVRNLAGQMVQNIDTSTNQIAKVGELVSGVYLLYGYDTQGKVLWVKKMVKL